MNIIFSRPWAKVREKISPYFFVLALPLMLIISLKKYNYTTKQNPDKVFATFDQILPIFFENVRKITRMISYVIFG